MLPFISLAEQEFTPLISLIKHLFHGKYLSIPREFRLILLCGKALNGNTNKAINFKSFIINWLYSLIPETTTEEQSNRQRLIEYAQKKSVNHRYLLAEKILHDDFDRTGLDLLRGEHYLADIVDCIFIFLESWGTAAELGAFAISKRLSEKILVVNNIQYKNDNNSFLTKGPLKLVNRQSAYGTVLFCDLNAIHVSLEEILDRIEGVKMKRSKRIHLPVKGFDEISPKSWLLLIRDLVRLVGPIDSGSLEYLVSQVICKIKRSELYDILSIAISIKLLEKISYANHNLYKSNYDTSKENSLMGLNAEKISLVRMQMSSILSSYYSDYYEMWKAK